MKHMYGEFSENQLIETKRFIRKQIFYILLCIDPNTRDKTKNTNVDEAFNNLLNFVGGLNEILFEPVELVKVISLLEKAKIEYEKNIYNPENWNHSNIRKVLLDAGNEVNKIREVK